MLTATTAVNYLQPDKKIKSILFFYLVPIGLIRPISLAFLETKNRFLEAAPQRQKPDAFYPLPLFKYSLFLYINITIKYISFITRLFYQNKQCCQAPCGDIIRSLWDKAKKAKNAPQNTKHFYAIKIKSIFIIFPACDIPNKNNPSR